MPPDPTTKHGSRRTEIDSIQRKRLRVAELSSRGMSEREIAAEVRCSPAFVNKWKRNFQRAPLPSTPGLPVEDLVEHRKRLFEHKRLYEDARKLIQVRVTIPGPVGVLHFGDPHVDDDGTDISALERHTDLVRRTPGLFAANVGDTTNNWVGRLARLYAEQSTTAADGWRLAEWFIRRCDWLYLIGGNHDQWSGAGDPLLWIAAQQDALYEASEVRLQLSFPSGRPCIINARHDFGGNSQWNPAHGPMKAAQLGVRDDILVCGHKHKSGYSILTAPGEDRLIHCLQVGSYKIFDRYAKEKGFRDQHISPSVLTVIDPESSNATGYVTVFHDIELGVDWLKWRRRKAA